MTRRVMSDSTRVDKLTLNYERPVDRGCHSTNPTIVFNPYKIAHPTLIPSSHVLFNSFHSSLILFILTLLPLDIVYTRPLPHPVSPWLNALLLPPRYRRESFHRKLDNQLTIPVPYGRKVSCAQRTFPLTNTPHCSVC